MFAFFLALAVSAPAAKSPDVKLQLQLQVLLTAQAEAERDLARIRLALPQIETSIRQVKAKMCGTPERATFDVQAREWICKPETKLEK